jgi:hypothetical protein
MKKVVPSPSTDSNHRCPPCGDIQVVGGVWKRFPLPNLPHLNPITAVPQSQPPTCSASARVYDVVVTSKCPFVALMCDVAAILATEPL